MAQTTAADLLDELIASEAPASTRQQTAEDLLNELIGPPEPSLFKRATTALKGVMPSPMPLHEQIKTQVAEIAPRVSKTPTAPELAHAGSVTPQVPSQQDIQAVTPGELTVGEPAQPSPTPVSGKLVPLRQYLGGEEQPPLKPEAMIQPSEVSKILQAQPREEQLLGPAPRIPFNEATVGMPATVAEAPGEMGRGLTRGYLGSGAGVYHRLANAAQLLRQLSDTLSGETGRPESQVMTVLERFFKNRGADFQAAAQEFGAKRRLLVPGLGEVDFNKVAEGVGATPLMLAELSQWTRALGSIGGFAGYEALSATDKGAVATAIAAGKGAALGTALKVTQGLPTPTRVAATTTIGGGQAALEGGDISDIVSGALVLGGLSLIGTGERALAKRPEARTKAEAILVNRVSPERKQEILDQSNEILRRRAASGVRPAEEPPTVLEAKPVEPTPSTLVTPEGRPVEAQLSGMTERERLRIFNRTPLGTERPPGTPEERLVQTIQSEVERQLTDRLGKAPEAQAEFKRAIEPAPPEAAPQQETPPLAAAPLSPEAVTQLRVPKPGEAATSDTIRNLAKVGTDEEITAYAAWLQDQISHEIKRRGNPRPYQEDLSYLQREVPEVFKQIQLAPTGRIEPVAPESVPRGTIPPRPSVASPLAQSRGYGAVLDLSDPDSITAFVMAHGGLKVDPAKRGEFATIPLNVKNNMTGMAWDDMADLAREQGVDARDFLNAVSNLGVLRRQKQERATAETRTLDQERRQAGELSQWAELPERDKITRIAAMLGTDEANAQRLIEAQRTEEAAFDFFTEQTQNRERGPAGLEPLSDVSREAPRGVAGEPRPGEPSGPPPTGALGRSEPAAPLPRGAEPEAQGLAGEPSPRGVVPSPSQPVGPPAPKPTPAEVVSQQPSAERTSYAEDYLRYLRQGGSRPHGSPRLRQDIRAQIEVDLEQALQETSPRFEQTPEGQQAVLPTTPGREVPTTKIRPETPQRPVEELPLLGGAERESRQREIGVEEPKGRYGDHRPDERLTRRAEQHFGTTEDWREAGWILPDGAMLDLSGRHESNMPGGGRIVDHRQDLGLLMPKSKVPEEKYYLRMWEFMDKTGAIRFSPESAGFDFVHPPTDAQLRQAVRAAREKGEPLRIDQHEADGSHVRSWEFDDPTVETTRNALAGDSDEGIVAERRQEYQPAPIFFSMLQRAIEQRMPERAVPDHVRAIAAQGAKADEVKWTGLDDWLASKKGAKVTKQEVLDFLRQNEVRVEEVVKGGVAKEVLADFEEIKQLHEQAWIDWDTARTRLADILTEKGVGRLQAIDLATKIGKNTSPETFREVNDVLRQGEPEGKIETEFRVMGPINRVVDAGRAFDRLGRRLDELELSIKEETQRSTKFKQYTLSGGKEYRELLLTLPSRQLEPVEVPPVEVRQINDSQWQIENRLTRPGQNLTGIVTQWRGSGWEEHGQSFPNGGRDFRGSFQNQDREFRTFDEAVAWVKEVQAPVLRRVAEQEQSVPGYRSPHFDEPNVLAHIRMTDRTDAQGKRVLFIEEIQSDWHAEGRRKGYRGQAYPEEVQKVIDEVQALGITKPVGEISFKTVVDAGGSRELADKWLGFIQRGELRDPASGVPPAPFAKTWHELVLKRMLRYASEHGYDKLAWTTGEQQAERYDLSKQIDTIQWDHNPDGSYDIAARKGGQKLIGRERIDTQEMEQLVGKDITQRIVEGVGRDEKNPNMGRLTGLDLKVGGEGLKALYDRIIPQFLNQYGKKWGARVGETEIQALSPENKAALAELRARPENARVGDEGIVKVPAIDITPEMRHSVMTEGQALFEKRGRYNVRDGEDPARARQLAFDALGALDRAASDVSTAGGTLARSARGVPAGAGARTLGLGITRSLIQTGRVDLRGQIVRTAEDLARLAQVYRNPSFETLRIFYLKGDTIVAHEGISSRMPASSGVFISRGGLEGVPRAEADRLIAARAWHEMRQRMQRLGADGYYLLHNHPSGKSEMSAPDKTVSFQFDAAVPGFKGHVVIDSGEYTVLSPDHLATTHPLGIGARDVLLRAEIPHDLLGQPLKNADDAARLGMALQSPKGFVSVLYRAAEGQIRAIQEIPRNLFVRVKEATDYIRGQARAFGGADVVSFVGGVDLPVEAAGRQLIKNGSLRDHVTSTFSLQSLGARRDPSMEFGQPIRRQKTFRVAERNLEEPLTLQTKDGKPLLTPREAERLAETLRQQGREVEVRTPENPALGRYRQVFARWAMEAQPSAEAVQGQEPAPGSLRSEAGRLVLRRPQTPAPPQGTPLAEINAMVPATQRLGVGAAAKVIKERVIETQVNRFMPMARLSEALQALGAAPAPGKAPIEVAELTQNRIRGQVEAFGIRMGRIVRDTYDEGLLDPLRQYLTLKQFEKRIRDLSARPESDVLPTGRTSAGGFVNPRQFDRPKVDAGLQQLEQSLTPQQFQAVQASAQQVWALNRTLLDKAHEAGIVGDDAYTAIVGRGDDYVPMQVLDYISEAGQSNVKGRPLNVRYQDVLKRMEGTERDVRDVLAATADKAMRTIATINRNVSARAVTDLQPQLPGLIEKVAGDTFKVPGDKEVISVFENGHRVNYAVPPEIARAMNYLDAQGFGMVEKILSVGKTPLQVGATGANIGFSLPNLIRDVKRFSVYSKYGFSKPSDAITIPLDWLRGLYSVYKQDAGYLKFLESGAAFSTIQKNLTPEGFLKRAAGLPGPLSERVNIFKWMVEGAQQLNSAIEEATKLTSTRRGLASGATPEEVAYETANFGGSPNFARAGSWGQHVNLLWMFYNARLQGTAANIRRLREIPSVAGKAALSRVVFLGLVPMTALWAYNQQFAGDHGLEDVSDSDKQKYHIILLPDTYQAGDGSTKRKYVKIAKEETDQIFGGLLEAGLNALADADPHSAQQTALDLLGNLSPVTFDVKGDTLGAVATGIGAGVLAATNPVIRLPGELTANYNARTQGAIVPRGLAEQVRPEDQARPTTSPTMIQLGKILGMSPIKLEYAITSGTGGLGQTALDVIDKAQGKTLPATVGEYERTARVPVVSRFLGTSGNQQDRLTEERFYQFLDEAKRDRGSITVAGPERRAELLRQPELRTKAQVAPALETLSRALTEVRKAQVYVTHVSQASTEQKTQALKALADRHHEVLQAFRRIEQSVERIRAVNE